ncbi:MAG TPA: TonB-dependent receptor [Vicinamibacterales bacterium]|nr:TonB-dependent receptor [Vicinamibacterales bacterium]
MRTTRLAMFTAVLLFVAAAAHAQETTTGSIGGQVVDTQGLPIPGATVTVTGPQGVQSFVTDNDGRFLAPFLTPGEYAVRVELQGFRPIERRNVQVRLGQRVELTDLRLQVGAVTEVVEVTASSPTVDVTRSTAQTNITSALLSRIPIGRQFSETLYIAPGVTSGGGTGQANPSVGGSSGLENQYIVDGIDITNAGYGALGSYSIIFGSLGTGTPFDFIAEVQVKTAGFEAEFGQATGGVVNVVTKSGSNDLRGSAFAYIRPEGLEAAYTQLRTVNGIVNTTATQVSDAGLEAGGRLVRDRLFFFGAIDPQWDRRTLVAPEDFPLRALGEVDRDRRIVAYSAKVTGVAAPDHRLEASFFGDPGEGDEGPQRTSALLREDRGGFSEIERFGGHNQTLKYDAILTSRWLLEASVARAANTLRERPVVDEWFVTDTRVTPFRRFGGLGFFENNEGETWQLQAKSTHVFDRGGSHQVRYGLQYERVGYDNIVGRSGPTFVLPDGTRTVTGAQISVLGDPGVGAFYRVTRANISNVRETEQDYVSFFVQDTWRLGNRLTIKPGLRFDDQRLIGNLDDHRWGNNWAPRLGVVFDPTGGGRMKLYGNWGRFYVQIPNDLAARALSADASVTRADYFDAGLTRPIPDGLLVGGTRTHFVTAGLSASEIDPESKATYLDEALAGFEVEAFPNVNVGIRYIHRTFGRVLEDVGTLPMVAYFLEDVPGAESVEYFITNPSERTPVTGELGFPISFEEPIHEYDALEITAEKRFSNNWGVQASYRWSRLHGTFEGFFRNDNGQSDPAITSLFDFPTNDPSYVALGRLFGFRGDIRFLGAAGAGPLPNDRPHAFKLFGNYAFPMGLNLGVAFRAESGAPLTAMAANPVYDNGGEIPETPRGEGIQTVDGLRRRTETVVDVGLHADYSIRFGGRRLVLLADVFNLFDAEDVLQYDYFTENRFTVPNPDFGQRTLLTSPRQVRLGARFEF